MDREESEKGNKMVKHISKFVVVLPNDETKNLSIYCKPFILPPYPPRLPRQGCTARVNIHADGCLGCVAFHGAWGASDR